MQTSGWVGVDGKAQKNKLIWDDSACGIVCHSKCSEKLPKICSGSRTGQVEVIEGPLRESDRPDKPNVSLTFVEAPSMFGKELGEQVASDKSQVPMIVTKCISAVEAVGE